MKNEGLLTARKAAAELGVHVGTAQNAFQESHLLFVALYGHNLITRPYHDAYKQRTQPKGAKNVSRLHKEQEVRAE